MKIGSVPFGKNVDHTLGLEVVIKDLQDNFNMPVERATAETARNYDVLLLSLYWWEHSYDLVRFLLDAGINPVKRKPLLVIGGSQCVNPLPLAGFFHYANLGDGESVAG